jgi:WD40 repeat protein
VTGKELRTLTPEGKAEFESVAFSHNWKTLALSVREAASRSIRFWDLSEEKWLGTIPQGTVIRSLHYSPDGQVLALALQDGVSLWDVGRRVLLHTFPGHLVTGQSNSQLFLNQIASLRFSPDGRTLATCGNDGTARMYDVDTRKEIRTLTVLPARAGGPNDLVFSPDGTHVTSAGGNGHLKSWEVASGREARSFLGHIGVVTCAAFSPDGTRLASGDFGGEIKVWDATAEPTLSLSPGRIMFTGRPVFSPDGKLLAVAPHNSGAYRGQVEVRHLLEAKPSFILDHTQATVTAQAFSPDGKVLATACSSQAAIGSGQPIYEIKLWDLESRRADRLIPGFKGPIQQLAFSPDGKFLGITMVDRTGGAQQPARRVKLLDLHSGKEQASFTGTSVAFSPTGQLLAVVGADHVLRLIDRESSRELRSWNGREDSAFVTYSRDGTRLFFADAVWDAMSGAMISKFEGIDPVADFSPDGKRLFSITPTTRHLRVWDATSGDLLLVTPVPGRAVVLHPDGWRCAVSGSEGIWLVDARPLTPELRQRQEARNLVAHLYSKPMLKDEVLALLTDLKTITEPVRQEALVLARQQELDCNLLQHHSGAIMAYPNRTPDEYRRAVKWMEAAHRLAPEFGTFAQDLGAALYYTGQYERAAFMAERAHQMHLKKAEPGEVPAYDLLILAMAQWKLGRHEEARATLQHARDPRQRANAIVPYHWRQAEELIEGKPQEPKK